MINQSKVNKVIKNGDRWGITKVDETYIIATPYWIVEIGEGIKGALLTKIVKNFSRLPNEGEHLQANQFPMGVVLDMFNEMKARATCKIEDTNLTYKYEDYNLVTLKNKKGYCFYKSEYLFVDDEVDHYQENDGSKFTAIFYGNEYGPVAMVMPVNVLELPIYLKEE